MCVCIVLGGVVVGVRVVVLGAAVVVDLGGAVVAVCVVIVDCVVCWFVGWLWVCLLDMICRVR